jgi:hypothetical protein
MTPRSIALVGRRWAVEGEASPSEVPPPDPSPGRPRRFRRALSGTLLAFVHLVFVLSVAVGTLLVGGVVLHAISPSHTFDIFYALHQQIVVGTLLGLAIFWLLPPHPWVNESEDSEVREPALAAGETGGGDVSNVTALAEYRGRDLSRRPRGQGEVAG